MNGHSVYLGLCSTYHDPALALVSEEGEVLFAEATERFLQYKRGLNCEPDNPFILHQAIRQHCNDPTDFVIAGNWRSSRPLYERLARALHWLTPNGIMRYRGRQLTSFLETWELNHMQASQHYAMRRAGINLARELRLHYPHARVRFRHYNHHLTHAALACYSSPFKEAECAVIDSYGEHGSLAFYQYRNGRLLPRFLSRGPQSLGFFYMKLTELCGFDWMAGEEWKVMGLAPYGKPNDDILHLLRRMLKVGDLDLQQNRNVFFDALTQLNAWRRKSWTPPEAAADLACSGQRFFVDTVNQLLTNLHMAGDSSNLALAGGCALNSVCNGQLLEQTPFENLHVPSAPADDGTALGAALLAWHEDHPGAELRTAPLTPYLGNSINQAAIERFAHYSGLPVQHLPGQSIVETTAKHLTEGKIIGWIQGRAEFGPRALGNRSILADPRSPDMMDRINRVVKFREQFRPYAPAILHEHGDAYFEHYQETPYMDRTLRFRSTVRQSVPAVVHVDGTGRLQTVKADWNRLFHQLLESFHSMTGIPVLLNTSFNVMGKPIVHSTEDAFSVFMGSGLDNLVMGEYLFSKPESNS